MSIRKCHFNNDPFYEPAEQNQQRIIDDFDVNEDEKSTEPFDDIFARKLQKCSYVNFTFQKKFAICRKCTLPNDLSFQNKVKRQGIM